MCSCGVRVMCDVCVLWVVLCVCGVCVVCVLSVLFVLFCVCGMLRVSVCVRLCVFMLVSENVAPWEARAPDLEVNSLTL